MDISVVLATYNRAHSLRAALESLEKLSVPPTFEWELIIVDNNSRDLTCNVVEKFKHQVTFPVHYVFEGQQGRSAALNTGIRHASGRIIAFTDDDVFFDVEWLSHLRNTFAETDCSAVAGRVLPIWHQSKPEWLDMEDQLAIVRFDMGNELKEIRVPPLGANCAFRRHLFARYGLFRLDLGVNGSRHTITCDDTEFGERLIRAGEKIVYCPSAIVYHPVDPGRATKQYFLSWYYYNGRSVTRIIGLPGEGVFYFGVPRWLLRRCAADIVKWLSCFDHNQRFRRKLQMLRSLGSVVESHHLSRRKSAMAKLQSAVTS